MTAIERDRLLDWLLANGGPIVRYRTARELSEDVPQYEQERLGHELLACPLVQQWLGRLSLGSLAGELEQLNDAALQKMVGGLVHGSKPGAFENVLGKLSELGLRAGMPGVDERMLPLMHIFRCAGDRPEGGVYRKLQERLVKSIFAWGLLRAGYAPDPFFQDYLCAHVEQLYAAARDEVYSIYASGDALNGLPKAWAGKPILRQEVLETYALPTLHDLYVLAYLPGWIKDAQTCRQIERIIAYVFDPRFQALYPGYGYAWIKERRACYSLGWSPHLAGYLTYDVEKEFDPGPLVQQMELMARFPAARAMRWFQSSLRHLEWFRNESGTYCFPPNYLRDLPDGGYYVSGYGMSLGENRRRKQGLEIESTFRMLKILTEINGCADWLDPILL